MATHILPAKLDDVSVPPAARDTVARSVRFALSLYVLVSCKTNTDKCSAKLYCAIQYCIIIKYGFSLQLGDNLLKSSTFTPIF